MGSTWYLDHLKASTAAMYVRQQYRFLIWCEDRRIAFPASMEQVAKYLRIFAQSRVSPGSVRAQSSAISRLYHEAGLIYDTKNPALYAVLQEHKRPSVAGTFPNSPMLLTKKQMATRNKPILENVD